MSKIALYGKPGAGKSTFASLLTDELVKAGGEVATVKVAAPLYQLQLIVYEMAGVPLVDPTRQDGRLLNFLGTEMRRINPRSLTDVFAARVQELERTRPEALLVCDDLRGPDVDAVTALGFRLVEISAPAEVRALRKAGRGDLTAGDEQHPTEAQPLVDAWRRVRNAGSLEDLRGEAALLAGQVLR
ncbi:hypothetical protein [Streptomyces goshikiensis]|uniref:hypothetical protein n=1 Tax=Streptomyces goshikiensis TaxID=1942 RepID=UPI0036591392